MTVSICLTPAREQCAALDAVIASYAAKHGRSPFRAHLTLVTAIEAPPAFEALEAAAACFAGPMRFDGLEPLTHNCVSTSQSDIAAWRYSAMHALAD